MPSSTLAVATQTEPVVANDLWQLHGTKYRAAMVPSRRGAATRPIFGTTLPVTSPKPMRRPASCRIASIRAISAVSASSSAALSCPVLPMAAAGISTIGMLMSMQVTRTPSMISARSPLGNSAPDFDPAPSRNASFTGAALPGTPSIRVVPA